MEVPNIENMTGSNGLEALRLKGGRRICLFYKEEVCCAPRIRFETCRTCVLINEKVAVKGLFERIKGLADKLFNLQATEREQPPPPLSGQH